MARSRFAPPAIAGAPAAGPRLETRRRSGQFRPFDVGMSPGAVEVPDPGPAVSPEEQQRNVAREEARRDGYARGLQEGREQAQAETEAYHRQLADSIESLARANAVVAETRRRELVELALAAAEALVQRELASSETALGHLVDVGLKTLGRSEPVSIHLNPDDVQRVSPIMHRAAAAGFDVQILEDPSLSSGDLRIDNKSGTVESVLHDRLARIRQLVIGELGSASDPAAPAEDDG